MSSILMRQVNKLRDKPAHHRQAWAFGLSIGFTSVIALIWAANLSLSLSGSSALAVEKVVEPSPFSQVATVAVANLGLIKNGFVVFFNDIGSLLGN